MKSLAIEKAIEINGDVADDLLANIIHCGRPVNGEGIWVLKNICIRICIIRDFTNCIRIRKF